MRPLTPLAAFLAAFVLLAGSVQLSAQRGGAHASGGGGHAGMSGHGGFSGGSGGHSFSGGSFGARSGSRSLGGHSAGHSFSGARAGSTFARRPSARAGNGRSLGARNYRRSPGLRLRTYGRNNCYGLRCGYAYPWGYGGFDPYWWWDSGSSYDQDQPDQIGAANQMNQQSLDEQRMRRQDDQNNDDQNNNDQNNNDQNSYAQAAPSRHPPERTVAAPATVLVFRDQHKQEVQNYAIVGQTLWNFASQRTEKISLDDIDIPATTKTNEDRGVDFRVPVMQGRLTLQIQSVD